jgi:hypothetical protein
VTAEPTAEAAAATPLRRRRPFGVTVLAVLQGVRAVLWGLLLFILVSDPADAGPTYEFLRSRVPLLDLLPEDAAGPLAIGTATIACAATLLSLILLLRLSRSGWTLTMLLTGLSLAAGLLIWWGSGALATSTWILDIATALYLNQREVRRAFGIGASTFGAMLEGGR